MRKFIIKKMILEEILGQSNNKEGRVFALHMSNPGSISSISYVPHMIPEHRSSKKPRKPPGVSPKREKILMHYKKITDQYCS